jgi:hypothetical protein
MTIDSTAAREARNPSTRRGGGNPLPAGAATGPELIPRPARILGVGQASQSKIHDGPRSEPSFPK